MSNQALLRRVERLEAASGQPENAWQCPERWEDFARLSDVRYKSKIIKLDPYWYQQKIIDELQYRSIVVGKTRQLGLTETLANWALWRACREPGFAALFLSKRQEDTSNIARRVRRSIDGFKGAIKLKTNNICDLELVGGGRLMFANSSPNGARSLESVTFCLCDESAFVPGMEEIYTSLGPALSSGGDGARIAIVSTPDGQEGWYWQRLNQDNGDVDLMQEIEATRKEGFKHWVDDSGWGKFLVHWQAHPEHSQNENYLAEIKAKYGLSERALRQEFDLNFTESSKAVFSAALVQNAIDSSLNRLKLRSKGAFYAGVDSCGSGEDYAVCCILRLSGDALELVQWYRGKSGTSDLHLFRMGGILNEWSPRSTGVEKNSMGVVWLESLQRNHKTLKFEGITTSATSKSVMIDRLLMLLESGSIRIPSGCPIIEELLSFQRSGNQIGAATGKHDDFVMALALAVSVSPLGNKLNKKLFTLN